MDKSLKSYSSRFQDSNVTIRKLQGSPITKSWTLRCKICGKPLSVGPIFISLKGSNICGRCYRFSEKEIIRNKVYEKIALGQIFPCIYDGCNDVFPWSNVKEHEKYCLFKPFLCIIDKCDWKGYVNHLGDHFKNEHKSIHLEENEEFKLDLKHNQNIKLLNHSLNMLFKIEIDFDMDCGVLKLKLIPLEIHFENDIESVIISVKDNDKNVIEKNVKEPFDEVVVFQNIFSFLNKAEIHCGFKVLSSNMRLKPINKRDFLKVRCRSCDVLITDYIYIYNIKNFPYCKSCKFLGSHKVTYDTYCATQHKSKSSKFIIFDEDFVDCPHIRCPYQIKKIRVENHAEKCAFKVFDCRKCNFKNNFEALKRHYIDHHLAIVDNKYLWTTNTDFGNETVEIILNNAIFHIKKTRKKSNSLYDFENTCIQFDVDVETVSVRNEAKYRYHIELLHQTTDFLNLVIEGTRQNSALIGKICVDNSNLNEYRNEAGAYTFKIVIVSF